MYQSPTTFSAQECELQKRSCIQRNATTGGQEHNNAGVPVQQSVHCCCIATSASVDCCKLKNNKKACPRVHAVGRPPLLPAGAANQTSRSCVHATGQCSRASTAAASRAVPVVASCPQSQSVIRAMHAARHIGISEASAAKPRKTHDGFTQQVGRGRAFAAGCTPRQHALAESSQF